MNELVGIGTYLAKLATLSKGPNSTLMSLFHASYTWDKITASRVSRGYKENTFMVISE